MMKKIMEVIRRALRPEYLRKWLLSNSPYGCAWAVISLVVKNAIQILLAFVAEKVCNFPFHENYNMWYHAAGCHTMYGH
jgi:hypothetical protein